MSYGTTRRSYRLYSSCLALFDTLKASILQHNNHTKLVTTDQQSLQAKSARKHIYYCQFRSIKGCSHGPFNSISQSFHNLTLPLLCMHTQMQVAVLYSTHIHIFTCTYLQCDGLHIGRVCGIVTNLTVHNTAKCWSKVLRCSIAFHCLNGVIEHI